METYTEAMLQRVQFPYDELVRVIDAKVIRRESSETTVPTYNMRFRSAHPLVQHEER